MKLIYLVNARVPTEKAHGLQIMKMCQAFNHLGLDLELIIPRRFNQIKENYFEYYNIPNTFKITKLPCLDLVFLGKTGYWIELISFLLATRIYLCFKKYDLLYTRDQASGLFFEKYVLELHNLPDKIKYSHKKLWLRSKKIVVLTNLVKKKLINLGIKENIILVAPDAVDLVETAIKVTKIQARKELSLPLNKKIIVYTGSFDVYNWKGVDVLLAAATEFSQEYLFVLVGAKQTKYDHNIRIIKHQFHKEIPYYLKAADVLVLPNKASSKSSEEYTSPLKLFEYMAAQRPIIASALPSIKEILNKHNSLLVTPNDPQELAQAIIKILANQKLANSIAQQAFLDVQKYTWQRRAQKIINFIK